MSNQNLDPDQNPLLNPKFGLNTDNPDVKGFLTWLFDPEVDKAFEQLDKESEQDEN